MTIRNAYALLVAILTLCGCSVSQPTFRTFLVNEHSPSASTFDGIGVESGQLIVSDAGGADSLLISLLGTEHTSYVHAGIVVIEHGKPFVYEGYAMLRPFVHGPPTDALYGYIRRVTLARYLRRQRVTAIFAPPAEVDTALVAAYAQARHRDRTPFDPYFDWRDHSRLYCTEFAALALHAGGGALPDPVDVRDNPSLRIALDWLKVSAPGIVTADSLTRRATRVALISRRYDPTQVTAYFAAKRELHKRFSTDQKLGNVWRWSWRGLTLQPGVREFLRASRKRPQASTALLANDILGSFEPPDALQARADRP